MKQIFLKILEAPQDFAQVENLQLEVWPNTPTDVVPGHMLMAAVHNGGLVVGAYEGEVPEDSLTESLEPVETEPTDAPVSPDSLLVGFVFGFPGIYTTPDGPRLKHHSHMMGVLPRYRDQGIGFLLKRAQWQMVRYQGLDRITWTYDPLLSRNAYLNIARLGGVCSTYITDFYGEMRDSMNASGPSDRFQVDWWVNSWRVTRRLSRRPRKKLDLAHYLAAGVTILNPTDLDQDGLPHPGTTEQALARLEEHDRELHPLLLVEIPADFLALKEARPGLVLEWRYHTRLLFQALFSKGFLITDFVHLRGTYPRSFYALSNGESTL
jgi:predicted GNAT superfamily acetyltransferase